ncbi:hypothetical protein EUGRSUZ_A00345 [Eucalyptus grandis]|uniref:Uncharacterized protein n=2 Tax=Eucalyptus grandis TaxID=71139 RepID=A0ACC3LZH6_EUCGR|nr:hypothetical protein EUGRSUZ_A00345 [Eucalyptus grandis]
MSPVDWFCGPLLFWGRLHKEAKILFLGLDNAGKTTLLRILKDEFRTSVELRVGKINFKAFDLGGRQIARGVWPDYYAKVDAVIYVVPFLMLGNKIDIPHAASEDELGYHLGLTDFTTGKGKVNLADQTVRPLEVFMCSVVRKMGYGEGFEWMSQYIK